MAYDRKTLVILMTMQLIVTLIIIFIANSFYFPSEKTDSKRVLLTSQTISSTQNTEILVDQICSRTSDDRCRDLRLNSPEMSEEELFRILNDLEENQVKKRSFNCQYQENNGP